MITSLIRPILLRRLRALDRYATEAEAMQRNVLAYLVSEGRQTQWGSEHGYSAVGNYEQFVAHTPLNTYEQLKAAIDRMRHGEKDVLWPGQVKWYAKSSGTTSDKSKFLPVSKQALRDTHYRGGTDAVIWYLHNNPRSRILDGKALILGGSHSPNYNVANTLVGDLSAILIENINPLVNLVRIPDKQTALLADFEQKRQRIAQMAIRENVTNLSGVPSWMMSVLTQVLAISGKKNLCDVWPNLEVFFHGGVAFTPYRQQYNEMIPTSGMHYMETYNASEGFFALQDDPADTSMSLMVDYGVFYEFVPVESLFADAPQALPLWEVETGREYAMVITTSSGLWRYMIGDTVTFTSKAPYKIRITGRTKSFINAFGEELIVDNAEKGLARACQETGAQISDYTAAPIFMDAKGKCRHQWIIEFAKSPADIDTFAAILDNTLQTVNSDYEAKRYKDITLQRLQIVVAPRGLFNQWMAKHGKLGGQHKVPRLCNNRDIADELLQMMSK